MTAWVFFLPVGFLGLGFFYPAGALICLTAWSFWLATRLRKRSPERLLETGHERLQSVLELAPIPIIVFRGPTHIYEYVNPVASEKLYSRQPVVGRALLDGSPAIEKVRYAKLLDHVFTTGQVTLGHEEDVVVKTPDGGQKSSILNYTIMPWRNRAGEIQGVLAFVIDITEEARAIKALKVSEERLALACRATRDMIWDWDLETGHVVRNDAMRTEFGYDENELSGPVNEWRERIHPDDRERVIESLRSSLEKSKTYWSDEYRFRRADGTYAQIYDRGYVVSLPSI